jgi:hypothetical protein
MLNLTDNELSCIRKVLQTYLIMADPNSFDYEKISSICCTLNSYFDFKESQASDRMDMGD